MNEPLTDEHFAWYILDEIAVECSSKELYDLSNKAEEAMKLLNKPTPEQCREIWERRNK